MVGGRKKVALGILGIGIAAIAMAILVVSNAASRSGTHAARPPYDHTPRDSPMFFHLLRQGVYLESAGSYLEALSTYEQSLAHLSLVAPDVRNQAEIAAHNRRAACLMKLGRFSAAQWELGISQRLGDTRHAPRVLARLRALGTYSVRLRRWLSGDLSLDRSYDPEPELEGVHLAPAESMPGSRDSEVRRGK